MPQLLALFHLILCAASLQNYSSESSPRSETISTCRTFQMIHILSSRSVYSPHKLTHTSFMGFRSGDWDGHGKTLILWSVNHFYVDFGVCFGSLSLNGVP